MMKIDVNNAKGLVPRELLGIEADFVRMVAVRSGYLADEEKLWVPVKHSRRSPRSTNAGVTAHA